MLPQPAPGVDGDEGRRALARDWPPAVRCGRPTSRMGVRLRSDGLRRAALAVLLIATAAAPAGAAEALDRRFGSDDANAETFWTLFRKGVRFEASIGMWFAFLSAGLTGLTSELDDEGASKAIGSIGTGSGYLREVRFGLEVFGNEAFFSYLSDKLFAEVEDQVRDRVGNRLAQEAILLLIGELRPDLAALLGPDGKVWLRSEYGDIEGAIEEAWRFQTRNGEPWFAPAKPAWRTKYLSVEAGWFPDGRNHGDEFRLSGRKRRPYETSGAGDEGFGLFARYTSFSRPLALGFGDGNTGSGYILQDGALDMYALGVRYELLHCDTFCWRVSGTMIPFTGWANLDLGRFGVDRGVVFAGGGEVKASYPIDLFGVFAFSPYVSFRADWMMPILGSNYSTDIDEVQIWAPDYVLWGPTAGVTGRF